MENGVCGGSTHVGFPHLSLNTALSLCRQHFQQRQSEGMENYPGGGRLTVEAPRGCTRVGEQEIIWRESEAKKSGLSAVFAAWHGAAVWTGRLRANR